MVMPSRAYTAIRVLGLIPSQDVNEAGKVSADQLHETLLVVLHSNFAVVATTDAWTAAVTAGGALPKSDLGTSAMRGRAAFSA